MHAALRIELPDCFSHIATRELLHHFFECRVFLPHDLIKPRCFDPRFLELLIRSARFYRFMLARVTYQQHAVVFLEPMQELVYLLRARETRFVENVEPFLSVARLLASRQMPLQRTRFDSRFSEFLRGA